MTARLAWRDDSIRRLAATTRRPAIRFLIRESELRRAGVPYLLVGSRFAAEDTGMRVSLVRTVAMRILARSASRAVGSPVTDASSGFRVISEPLLGHFSRQFPAHYLGDTYEAMISAGRAGYVVREIGVPMRERTHGVSSAAPAAAGQTAFHTTLEAGALPAGESPSAEAIAAPTRGADVME